MDFIFFQLKKIMKNTMDNLRNSIFLIKGVGLKNHKREEGRNIIGNYLTKGTFSTHI